MAFETILYEEDGPLGIITLNRPDDGNMFTETMCHEIRDCMQAIRRETRTRCIDALGIHRIARAGDRKEQGQDHRKRRQSTHDASPPQ